MESRGRSFTFAKGACVAATMSSTSRADESRSEPRTSPGGGTEAEDNRGQNVLVLDMREQTTAFDYFVIATGTSNRQLRAMSDAIDDVLQKQFGHPPPRPRRLSKTATGSCSTTAPSSSTCSTRPSATTTGWKSSGPVRCRWRGRRPVLLIGEQAEMGALGLSVNRWPALCNSTQSRSGRKDAMAVA